MQELLGTDGFLSATTGAIGDRMFTTSAWTNPDAAAKAFRGGIHKKAVGEFFNDLGLRAVTMMFEPHHLNTMWKRGEDGKMVPADAEGPDAVPYW